VPLTSSDLLTPDGEIDGALFYPSLSSPDVSARVDAYLVQGYAKATAATVTDANLADRIARAFAYYRAWSDVVNRLTLSPASASLAGEVSTSFLQTQINEWILARDAWKAEYLALLPVDPDTEVARRGVSQAVRTEVRF
jgi:GH15 family glucan-1,4-alpha-glucosidase